MWCRINGLLLSRWRSNSPLLDIVANDLLIEMELEAAPMSYLRTGLLQTRT